MNKVLRNIILVILAALIVTAGITLPDLIIDLRMRARFDTVKYVDSEDIWIYDKAYISSRARLLEIIARYNRYRSQKGKVYLYEYSSAAIRNRFDEGCDLMMQFLNEWDTDIAQIASSAVTTKRKLVKFDDGTALGILYAVSPDNEECDICFDVASGIPIDINIVVTDNEYYVTTMTRLFYPLIEAYRDSTKMTFNESTGQRHLSNAGYHSLVAVNYDSSVSICAEFDYMKAKSFHFYLT